MRVAFYINICLCYIHRRNGIGLLVRICVWIVGEVRIQRHLMCVWPNKSAPSCIYHLLICLWAQQEIGRIDNKLRASSKNGRDTNRETESDRERLDFLKSVT